MYINEDALYHLKVCSKKGEKVTATVLNCFGQEFSFSGVIPNFYEYEDRTFINNSVFKTRIIINFGSDNRSTIRLYASEEECGRTIKIKNIKNSSGKILYYNPEYCWDMLNIRKSIYAKHGTPTFHQENEKVNKLAENYLGKVMICKKCRSAEFKNKECLITAIARGEKEDEIIVVAKRRFGEAFVMNIEEFNKYFECNSLAEEIETC